MKLTHFKNLNQRRRNKAHIRLQPVWTALSFYSASSCSSHRLMTYPKPRGSRRSYWPSLLLGEMPPWIKMATFLSQRGTPTYEAPVGDVYLKDTWVLAPSQRSLQGKCVEFGSACTFIEWKKYSLSPTGLVRHFRKYYKDIFRDKNPLLFSNWSVLIIWNVVLLTDYVHKLKVCRHL